MRRRMVLGGLAATALARPAIAQPARTATLRFVPQSSLPTLDPMFSSEVVTNHGFYAYDTLYSIDSKGVARPQMAEGHAVSDDGLVWRIRLRDGLMFHDGTPVRAADCAASLARWAKVEAFGLLLGKVVDRWGAPDDRTLEIRLSKPFPLLLEAIGKAQSRVAFIMPERLARTDPFKPVAEVTGSGPYRFRADEYVPGSRVVYERFDGYVPRAEPPDRATGGKIAHFPRIEWHVTPDAATASAALQAGEVDWWELPLPDLYASLAASRDIALQIDNPDGRVSFMRMNHLQPPFDDMRVRRAVLAAVSQADYMGATLGDDAKLWRACRSAFPCGTPYEASDEALMPGSVAAGQKLLRASGYSGQKVVVLNPTDNPLIAPLGEVTADLLQKLGMTVDLATSDWGTVVQRRSSREPVDKGGWSILHSYGTATGYASPAVNPLLRGSGVDGWFGWWTSPQAEVLVQQWLDAPNAAARLPVGQALGRLALEEVAIVPLGQWFGRTAFRRNITGVLPGGSPYPWNVRPA